MTGRYDSWFTSRDKFPCKNCEERKPGCHDHCERYQEAKKVNDARKAREHAERGKIHMANEHVVRNVARASGKKQSQK